MSKLEKSLSIIIISLMVLMVFGCKTKDKVTERERIKTVSALEEKKIDQTHNDIKIDSFAKKGSASIKITDNQSLELTQADPDKKIIVEDSNGNKLQITGANAVLKNNKETVNAKDTTEITLTKKDLSKNDKSEEKSAFDKNETQKRTSDSKVKTTSVWMWAAIGIIALAAIGLFAFRKKLF